MKVKQPARRTVAVATLVSSLLLPWSVAHAQLGDLLKQAGGAASSSVGSGALGGLGSLGGAMSGGTSLMPASTGNVAGLLEYCIQNNYLSANGASPVQDALMNKLGGKPSSNTDYTSGASGILDAGNGRTLDLSGNGLKQQLAKQVCDRVLTQAKSLL